MKIVFTILASILLIGCAHENIDLKDRIAYWKGVVNRNIPTGTPQRQIREWCLTRNIYCSYSEQQHSVRGNAEFITAQGVVSACSGWEIQLDIAVDDSGQSLSNNVQIIGSCL